MAFEGTYLLQCLIKIFGSVLCGFILGLERKTRNQAVGTRTLILICVSSCLLAILSGYMSYTEIEGGRVSSGDPTRIASGVVSGIGFLGGGAIIRQGLNIKGLTSAATIWTAAALGMTIGSGLYIQAAVVLAVVMFVLVALEHFEERFFPAGKNKIIHLTYSNDDIDIKKVKEAIQFTGIIVCDLNIAHDIKDGILILHYSVKTPKEDSYNILVDNLKQLGQLIEFSVTD